ncbi:MAG: nucleotide modification associated domain-containing protein [Proteobacteria bacterium]|nr:nucleotide modification associated domain-containing protein [Pseudomonadota bacterium]
MNQLHESMKKTFDKCYEISVAKNHDYAGNEDPYANFRTSTTVGVPVERGIMVRMMDKVSRINRLIDNEAQVKDESIFDTLSDLINYTAILKAYLEEK